MNSIEEYRKINHPYFNDKTFEVSNYGNVKNIKTGNIRTHYKGRIQFESSSQKTMSVPRLVALTFLAEPGVDYTKRKVKHLDGNINNNRVENLKWI